MESVNVSGADVKGAGVGGKFSLCPSCEILDPPKKGLSDTCEYRLLALKENFEVLLICDASADVAGAALNVHVGFFSDPDEIPGVAHFLEHLLFMGTAKYPDEAEYLRFLSEHAGGSNAYTDCENTNYHFTVSADFLEQALDR